MASESDALSGGREDEEDREVNESAALSKGREDDGREDEEGREASESANLNEGRGTRDDFLEAVEVEEADASESASLCGGNGARCVDFPCAETLLGLVIVMGIGESGLTL